MTYRFPKTPTKEVTKHRITTEVHGELAVVDGRAKMVATHVGLQRLRDLQRWRRVTIVAVEMWGRAA